MILTEIAQLIKSSANNISFIYAFNSTGKTRLSVEYKNLTKAENGDSHSGVYYNAFSEDLFIWDNDESNSQANIKLDIQSSSLNQYHSYIVADKSVLENKLIKYNSKFIFDLQENSNPEEGIDSISFYRFDDTDKTTPIKISRGEERIFVWCFFLALFEFDGWSGVHNSHIFIDDPISSMDDHNVFVTVDTILDIVKAKPDSQKIIITTHHIGFFSILSDLFEKTGSKFKRQVDYHVMSLIDDEISFDKRDDGVFLYHLHLMKMINDAIVRNKVYAYHFVLMRQVLETISSFFGGGRGFSTVLKEIGLSDDKYANIINSLSHKHSYRPQPLIANPADAGFLKEIFDAIQVKYKFHL